MSSSPDTDEVLIGTGILDQFFIKSVIARGGMGTVYLAEQPSMDRMAAIKLVRPFALGDAQACERFRKEARAASRLAHPNVVTVYNFGELDDGTMFLAMEYIDGSRLGSLIKQGALQPLQAIDIASQCIDALDYAHSRGVIHRDFKPDNVMLTRVGSQSLVKVLDFGIARLLGDGTVTTAGQLMGTPRYMSPEQCRGEVASAKSDQYALGLTLYEMVTGHPAMEADTPLGYLHMHQNVMPVEPSCLVPSAGVFHEVLWRMLAKDQEQRYPDLLQAKRALVDIARRLEAGDDGPAGRLDLSASNAVDSEHVTVMVSDPAGATAVGVNGFMGQPETVTLEVWGEGLVDGDAWGPLSGDGVLLASGADADLLLVDADQAVQVPDERPALRCYDRDPYAPWEVEPTGHHVTMGTFPLDPLLLATVARWSVALHRGQDAPLVIEGQQANAVEVVSSRARAQAVERVLADARQGGVRRVALQSVSELAEELLMNAFFHAPVDRLGRPRFADTPRSTDLALPAGERPWLHWAVTDRFVVVSVRDPFGTLTRSTLLSHLQEQRRVPATDGSRKGAGFGLRLVSRAAAHLVVALWPGRWCEVLGFVQRRPALSTGKSVSVLEAAAAEAEERALGERLTLRRSRREGHVLAELCGEVDETCDLEQLFSGESRMLLDLGEITRFNSMGVRNWVIGLRARPAGARLVARRCSVAFVSQMNMVPSLTEGLTVESILAPYYCDECDTESLSVVAVSEVDGCSAPYRTCSTCGSALSFDAMAEQYFAFLQ